MTSNISSKDRVFTAMSHREPDRVPFFLPALLHGARELGVSIREYFSKAENVIEGQMRLSRRLRHDFVTAIFYAASEIEAWGGEAIFFDDGSPNAGEPFIKTPAMINSLVPPRIEDSPVSMRILETVSGLSARVNSEIPVVGFVVSPFSVPIMQMGFAEYIELLYNEPQLFRKLMAVNEEFCVSWANAQFRAGADAVCYFDPVSSPTILPRNIFMKTGFIIASRVLQRINGPTILHLGSGSGQSIVDVLPATGAAGVGFSGIDDLRLLKESCAGKLTVLGALNNIEMRHWSSDRAETEVRKAIAAAGSGGGYVLSDQFGEIPWQVSFHVLEAISESVLKWGQYPLNWVKDYAG